MNLAMKKPPLRREVELRVESDAAPLLELWVQSWRQTYSEIDFDARREWFLTRLLELEADGAVTLCLRQQASPDLAGFVVINPATGWLDQLCVHPSCFGGGEARALVDAARRVSPRVIRLDVNADNHRARRFYEREGFTLIGAGGVSQSGRATVILEWRPDSKVSAK